MAFRTPIRRKTRQRSGFNVAGDTPGSECKIKKSGRININSSTFSVVFSKKGITVLPLFENEKGIIFFGAYLKPQINLNVRMNLTYDIENSSETISRTLPIIANRWNKIGVFQEINIIKKTEVNSIQCELTLLSEDTKIEYIDIFGINLGPIDYYYFIENEVEDTFYEKINIYIPEISYQNYDKINFVESTPQLIFADGDPIIIKSCNRCSRFLPIDALNERNTLSFSNHCVKRVPCVHAAFSRYIIKESDYDEYPKEFQGIIEDKKIIMRNGYQLECKSCKKFFVNAPLNPLRNSTQHREDSLRRRAIEVLVDTLLDKQWIYHKFRIEHHKEFDKYIWEKFDKKCFKCSHVLKNENEMDLDHTMPLASFWPLDNSATCLCKKCNSLKSDKFPVEFYSNDELKKLSNITGLSFDTLSKISLNVIVVEKLVDRIDWFFDVFLDDKDYQKIRDGKRTSDLIYKAILKQINTYYEPTLDLVELYKKRTGKIPKTITI